MASKSMPFCWFGSTDILTLLIITGHLCVLGKGIMCFYIKHCYEGSLSREAAVIMKIKQWQTCFAKCFSNKFSWAAPRLLSDSAGFVAELLGSRTQKFPGAVGRAGAACSSQGSPALLRLGRRCSLHRAQNKCKPLKGASVAPTVKGVLQTTFCSQVATEALDLQAANCSCWFGNHWLPTALWLKITKIAALLRLRKG